MRYSTQFRFSNTKKNYIIYSLRVRDSIDVHVCVFTVPISLAHSCLLLFDRNLFVCALYLCTYSIRLWWLYISLQCLYETNTYRRSTEMTTKKTQNVSSDSSNSNSNSKLFCWYLSRVCWGFISLYAHIYANGFFLLVCFQSTLWCLSVYFSFFLFALFGIGFLRFAYIFARFFA